MACHNFGGHNIGGHAVGGHKIGGHAVGGHKIDGHAVGGHRVGGHAVGVHSVLLKQCMHIKTIILIIQHIIQNHEYNFHSTYIYNQCPLNHTEGIGSILKIMHEY